MTQESRNKWQAAHESPWPNGQHTEGPWRTERNEDADEISITNFGGEIAVLHGVSLGDADEANARLIAAAPDLLAALELAEATIRRLAQRSEAAARSVLGTLDVTGDAIRKARGED